MNHTYDTQQQEDTQAYPTENQLTVLADLIRLLNQPASDHNTRMICHFWRTLPDRLSDQEWVYFQQLECDLFSQ